MNSISEVLRLLGHSRTDIDVLCEQAQAAAPHAVHLLAGSGMTVLFRYYPDMDMYSLSVAGPAE